MTNEAIMFSTPCNEKILNYSPDSPERVSLKQELAKQEQTCINIPLCIQGKNITRRTTQKIFQPHDHKKQIATSQIANEEDINSAIDSCVKAQPHWNSLPWEDRARIFLKAADLLCGKYRDKINAATILGQSKSCFQSEIDAVCELADFWRFNANFAEQIHNNQPISPDSGQLNKTYPRGLEGFVFAIAPFNFTSISANLATAPALMGCTVLWKPAPTAALSSWYIFEILKEAGLPDGVINFITGDPELIGKIALNHPQLAGVHFTGSTKTFESICSQVGNNINKYNSYPRTVGETGGKDFIFAHKSANPQQLTTAIIRGAFEFQGQKCSAASRVYVARSLWNKIKDSLIEQTNSIKMGNPKDFSNFMNAVIDKKSFDKISSFIEHAKTSKEAKIICGGECDDSVGYYIRPTIILSTSTDYKSMKEEIFGPIATIYVYEDEHLEETIKICNSTSPYALTGAIFAKDRHIINQLSKKLEYSAGNFYINDKPTGAVVGQQPFGGSRKSGTNDKAGSVYNLVRWCSIRTIKETFNAPEHYPYPHMN
jgi:1-pyrroline-5-carboxylate dehydrogenase